MPETLSQQCTENHIFLFQTSWKDGLSKKIALEFDLSCIIRKYDIYFSGKYDLTRRRKMKDDLFKKNTRKYDIFFKCSEKMVFSKRTAPGHDLSCTIWKGGVFSRKNDIFSWYGWPSQEIHGNMILSVWYVPRPPAKKKKIKDDPIPQKYTWGWLTFQIDTLERAPAILYTFMKTFTGAFKYCCSAKKARKFYI